MSANLAASVLSTEKIAHELDVGEEQYNSDDIMLSSMKDVEVSATMTTMIAVKCVGDDKPPSTTGHEHQLPPSYVSSSNDTPTATPQQARCGCCCCCCVNVGGSDLEATATFDSAPEEEIDDVKATDASVMPTQRTGSVTNTLGERPVQFRQRRRKTVLQLVKDCVVSCFQPSDNRLAMKLFGNRNALMRERRRQRATSNWIVHPCSEFRLGHSYIDTK